MCVVYVWMCGCGCALRGKGGKEGRREGGVEHSRVLAYMYSKYMARGTCSSAGVSVGE